MVILALITFVSLLFLSETYKTTEAALDAS